MIELMSLEAKILIKLAINMSVLIVIIGTFFKLTMYM